MDDDVREEYDFAGMGTPVRGKYAARYGEGTNVVVLAPDVAAVFRTTEEVNEALRLLIRLARAQVQDDKPISG